MTQDEDLLARIATDPAAFGTVFRAHYRPIFGYIFRRTGDADASADIAAEAFVKAFVHIRRFQPRGVPLKVWLYRIATNEVNMYFRHKRRRERFLTRLSDDDVAALAAAISEDRVDLEREMREHERFKVVQHAMMQLRPRYQEVLSLRFFEGKDNREIAAILGVSEGTIKSRVSRGLGRLRGLCAAAGMLAMEGEDA